MNKKETWEERNTCLVEQIEEFMDGLDRMASFMPEMLDWTTPFLAWGGDRNQRPYRYPVGGDDNFNIVFVVPFSQFDPEGWLDEDGMPFRERIGFMTKDRQGTWKPLRVFELFEMVNEEFHPYHPQFRMKEIIKEEGEKV